MKLLKTIETLSIRCRRMHAGNALVIAFAAVGLVTVTWAKHNRTPSASGAITSIGGPSFNPISAPQTQHLEAEVITLRPSGFEPAQISRSSGQFLLALNNQSGLEDMTLRLERENGVREQEVRFANHRTRWRARINLPAGNYFLRVAGHAEWVCRIAIR